MKKIFRLPFQTIGNRPLPVVLIALCLFPVAALASASPRDIPTDHSQFTWPAGYMRREPATPQPGSEDPFLPGGVLNLNDPDAFEQKAEIRNFYHVLTPDVAVVSADHEADKTVEKSRFQINNSEKQVYSTSGKDKQPIIQLRPIFN